MKNLKKIKMVKLIFVCYQHGFGGENLSYRLSLDDRCNQLKIKKLLKLNRTVILDELFEKNFLKYSYDKKKINKIYKDLKKNKSKKYYIVPTHFNYTFLKKKFKNSLFITIAPPIDTCGKKKVFDHIYKNVWQYSTSDVREFVGELLNIIDFYNLQSNNKKNKLVIEILKKYKTKLTFGGIRCVLNKLLPTIDNQKYLFENYKKKYKFKKLLTEIKKNTFVVSYEKINNICIKKVISSLI